MYQKILVALENGVSDQTLIPHIKELAKIHNSQLLLVHVADGWVARNYTQLQLAESEEMKNDKQYLELTAKALRKENLVVTTLLALGEPSQEIIKVGEKEKCDLIAMTSHGHRFFADIFWGSTIEEVRHESYIPLLIVKKGHPY